MKKKNVRPALNIKFTRVVLRFFGIKFSIIVCRDEKKSIISFGQNVVENPFGNTVVDIVRSIRFFLRNSILFGRIPKGSGNEKLAFCLSRKDR